MNNFTKAITKSIKRVALKVSKDKYLLSEESDFSVMLYHELMKEKEMRRYVFNTSYHIDRESIIDLVVYDKKERFLVDDFYDAIQEYDIKHFKALIELKISWGGGKLQRFLRRIQKEIEKRRKFKKDTDMLYILIMDIDDSRIETVTQSCIDTLKERKTTIIYSNPIRDIILIA